MNSEPVAAPVALPEIRLAMTEAFAEISTRALAALGVAGIALIHVLDAPGTYSEVRWMFWAYIALIVGAVPVAVGLLQWRDRRVWIGALVIAAAPLIGYILSRSIGLPGDADDKGNWLDTLGMTSLLVEALVITLSGTRLVQLMRAPATQPQSQAAHATAAAVSPSAPASRNGRVPSGAAA